RIPLSDVSRKHCRIVRDGDALKLEDLGSSNGSYLNGRRVQKEAALSPGDTIQIGPVVFVLQINGVPPDEDLRPVTEPAGGSAADAAPTEAGGLHPTAQSDLVEVEELQPIAEGEADVQEIEDLEPLEPITG